MMDLTAFGDADALLALIERAASAPEITREELLDPPSGELRKLTLESPVDLAALLPRNAAPPEDSRPGDRGTRIIPVPLDALRRSPARQGRALPPPLAHAFLRLFNARAVHQRLFELSAPDVLLENELRNVRDKVEGAFRVARGEDALAMRPIDFESVGRHTERRMGPESLLPSLPSGPEGQGRGPTSPLGLTILEREALLSFSYAFVHLDLATGQILHIAPIGHYRHVATSADERHCLFVRGGLYAGDFLPKVAVYDVSKRSFTTDYPASLPSRILVSIHESKQLESFDLRAASFGALPTTFSGDTASMIASSPDGELGWLHRPASSDEMGIFQIATGNTVLLPSYGAKLAELDAGGSNDVGSDDEATRAFVRLQDGSFRYVYDEQLFTYDPETERECSVAVGRSMVAAFDRSGRRLASATSRTLRVLELDGRGRVVDEHRLDLTPLRLHLTLDAFIDVELPHGESVLLGAVGTVANLASMDGEALQRALLDSFECDATDESKTVSFLASAREKASALPDRAHGPLRCTPLSPLPRTLYGSSGFAEEGARWIAKEETPLRWIAAALVHEGLTTLDRTPTAEAGEMSSELEEWVLAGPGARARAIREPLTGVSFVVLDGERTTELARSLERLADVHPTPRHEVPKSRVARRLYDEGREHAPLLRRALDEHEADVLGLVTEIREALEADDERRRLVAVYAALATRSPALQDDLERLARSNDDDDARRAAREALASRPES